MDDGNYRHIKVDNRNRFTIQLRLILESNVCTKQDALLRSVVMDITVDSCLRTGKTAKEVIYFTCIQSADTTDDIRYLHHLMVKMKNTSHDQQQLSIQCAL